MNTRPDFDISMWPEATHLTSRPWRAELQNGDRENNSSQGGKLVMLDQKRPFLSRSFVGNLLFNCSHHLSHRKHSMRREGPLGTLQKNYLYFIFACLPMKCLSSSQT